MSHCHCWQEQLLRLPLVKPSIAVKPFCQAIQQHWAVTVAIKPLSPSLKPFPCSHPLPSSHSLSRLLSHCSNRCCLSRLLLSTSKLQPSWAIVCYCNPRYLQAHCQPCRKPIVKPTVEPSRQARICQAELLRDSLKVHLLIITYAEGLPAHTQPTAFWEVLQKWQQMWMWENLQWVGADNWIAEAMKEETCIAVTDGSYMKELYLNIHSTALVLECSKGWGRLWCSFPEAWANTCSYQRESVSLMAIHLLLLAVNEVNPDIEGEVQFFWTVWGLQIKLTIFLQQGFPAVLCIPTSLKM